MKVTFLFTLVKALLDVFTALIEKKILLLLEDDFCDEVLEMTNFHEAGTFQKERRNFYSASHLIKTIFSCRGCPLQIALLLLWITFTSLKTFFWVKAYDFNICSPEKIRVYCLVVAALSSAISFWDLMVALISTEGAKFSDLSLFTSIRSESWGSALNSCIKVREGEMEVSFTKKSKEANE